MTTFEKIQSIIAATLNVSPDVISESLGAGDIPEWDSMGNMAIIAALEEQMGVEIPINDLFDLNNVKALVAEIDRLLK